MGRVNNMVRSLRYFHYFQPLTCGWMSWGPRNSPYPQESYLVYLTDLISFELECPCLSSQTELSLDSRLEQIGTIAQGSALLGKPSQLGLLQWTCDAG